MSRCSLQRGLSAGRSGTLAGRDRLGRRPKSVSLVRELLGELRRRRILMPSMAELERLVAACRHRARQRAYEVLTCRLNEAQREALDVGRLSSD